MQIQRCKELEEEYRHFPYGKGEFELELKEAGAMNMFRSVVHS